jgi:hypothetical protein
MIDVRKSAERQLGATYNDIIYFSKPMVSRHGFLTANNDVPYAVTLLSTTDGPVVLDFTWSRWATVRLNSHWSPEEISRIWRARFTAA